VVEQMPVLRKPLTIFFEFAEIVGQVIEPRWRAVSRVLGLGRYNLSKHLVNGSSIGATGWFGPL